VGLQHQLAAQAVLVVDEKRGDAELAQFDGRRQAGPPPTMSTSVATVSIVLRCDSASASGSRGRPSTLATVSPSRRGVMQALTGRPSAMTRHWEHWPLAQKIPWGLPSFAWWPKMWTPLAVRAEEIISPSNPDRG